MGLHVDSEIMPPFGRMYRFYPLMMMMMIGAMRVIPCLRARVISSHCCLLMRRMLERAMAP